MAVPALALEDDARWPTQGDWTWADYQRLPEDGQRYEIIRGVLYVSPAPIFRHQFVIARLISRLAAFVTQRDLGVVLGAPFDVLLPGVASPVQPDVLFIRRENQPAEDAANFEGVPDLVVEVLSPTSGRLDQHVKFGAYEEAGVSEYWLIDPALRTAVIYHLEEDGLYREFGRHGRGERAHSRVLEGFEIQIDELFPPRPATP